MNFYKDFENFLKSNEDISKLFFNNIFSFREVGNKTHGDMAEFLLCAFIQKYLSAYKCEHIGKQKFRAKESEEDLLINDIPYSLKNYGDNGALQIRTDKESILWKALETGYYSSQLLKQMLGINVICFLYSEKNLTFRVGYLDLDNLANSVKEYKKEQLRKHPIYRFYDENANYLFEIRYGGGTANALQRGVWTFINKNQKIVKTMFSGNYEINKNFLDGLKKLSFLNKTQLERFIKDFV